jgi:sarcosine oxidase subunit gamma
MDKLRYDVAINRLNSLALFEARGEEAALAGAFERCGFAWPARFNRLEAGWDGAETVRIGPRRVLLIGPAADEATMGRLLEAAFADVPEADWALVTDMHAAWSVRGPGAEAVLRQGAPLDLSPSAFPVGAVAGTELWGATAILIARPAPGPNFTLLVETSFAGYIEDWLAVASGRPSQLKPGVMSRPPRQLKP